jgi:hypothetical protein
LPVDTFPGCPVDTFAPLFRTERIRRLPFSRTASVLRTASISTGAYVLCSVFDRSIELAS